MTGVSLFIKYVSFFIVYLLLENLTEASQAYTILNKVEHKFVR